MNSQTGRYDGIHLYGSSGQKFYTLSVLNILKAANVTSEEYNYHLSCPQSQYMKNMKNTSGRFKNYNFNQHISVPVPGKLIVGGTPPPAVKTNDDLTGDILQLDGNISIISEDGTTTPTTTPTHHPIPVHIGNRANHITTNISRPQPCRKIIRRNDKRITALSLPRILNYNMRSLWSKSLSVSQDMHDREGDLLYLTEVWEKLENKKHQYKIQELLEMKGIKYISTPRPGPKRGGGAAIAVRLEKFTVSKLNIQIPRSVEVVWGLLRPKVMVGKVKTIIVCCFYSPPRSKSNNILVDHMTETLQYLLSIHRDAGIIISGDRNNLEISALLSVDPSLRQLVHQPTHGQKILDVIVTNLSSYYHEPVTIPPITPDKPGYGAPSDHLGVMASPNTLGLPTKKMKIRKTIRPILESLIVETL